MKFADIPFSDNIPFGGGSGGMGDGSSSYNNASYNNTKNNTKDYNNNATTVDDTMKLYDVLGIGKDADEKTIKKAYRKLCLKHHPDKGGNEKTFQEINAAHEILSDPEKRKLYDKYGLDGIDNNGGATSGGGADDLFSMFFGGRGGRGSGRRSSVPKKGPSINHQLKVSLEDLYNGKTKKLAINRKVIEGETNECKACDGRGTIMEMKSMGPGMITQMQRSCNKCKGHGYVADKTKTDRTIVEVHIAKGMKHNEKIIFRNMADEIPGCKEIGDVNFIIEEKEHPFFKRKNNDLLIVQTISLNQALCGYSFRFNHLDGREIIVKTKPGQIINPNISSGGSSSSRSSFNMPYTMIVPNEGMPSKGNPFVKGDLYVMFQIEFPQTLPKETIDALRKLLPDPNIDMEEQYDDDPMDIEEHFLVENNDQHRKKFGTGGDTIMSDAYYDTDDDEENNMYGQRTAQQCQTS